MGTILTYLKNSRKMAKLEAKSISSRRQFNNELEKAGDTLVVADFHQGSSVEHNSDFGEDYIVLNVNMEKHQDVANSQGISTPTICCYERKVKLTKLHVGFTNPESKFKQVMTGFVAARKLTQAKKKPVEENNNQILDSDVGISNNNEALKTKLEDEISIDVKPVPKSKAQRVSDFCTKILSTMEG